MLKSVFLAAMFQNMEDLAPGKAAFAILFGVAIMLFSFGVSLRYSKKYNKGYTYRRQVSSPYSRKTGREDDVDIPSGFGGPSRRDVVRLSDLKKPEDSGKTSGD